MHRPALLEEVIHALALKSGAIIVDCTVGSGGHAEAILQAIGPSGRFIGIDQDREAIERSRSRLAPFGDQAIVIRGNFAQVDTLITQWHKGPVDGMLYDLGVSSEQLASPERGMSFQLPGPLDMRMDQEGPLTAAMVVNRTSPGELETILRTGGEERAARRIAKAIYEARRERPIETTQALARIIHHVVRRRGKIDPATRSFQAIRLAVNRELELLEPSLKRAVPLLRSGGRLCVISFHSLDDRVAKRSFRQMVQEGHVRLIAKKPVRPTWPEVRANPRSRSARMRVVEKI